ncbi:MAG TPA: tol-pal system protein YbgF [Paenalcaligenes hominis]|uniref:Cell division coordinator CpoB n=1 Tax=Paenalcaligenes hominis TaxID=643674 RepID=A0A1U9JZQ6_9BURK|nr:tol-pal system protein YbgF [Paenalcaligenes hominis]AQS51246.1 tol-pal system protein YbgF [Paenalcaligenes hominis]NJB66344.1 tol-pal system protein YbgF [Paenalcaligenes hominis]GGE76188.1 tol-pal system protein YbgF [Paenalcaligenes hominis]HJH23193.1 tol-pal system protein YbgF [Paenalcaligenes hominis]
MSVHYLFRKPRLALLSGALLFGIALPTHAFADDEARRAIIELRQQIRQMNEQNQHARLMLADQIEMMRQEIAQLRGKVETLGWQSSQNQQNEQATQSLISDPQEQAAYEAAMDLYRNGQYQEAASGFGTFIEAYPNSSQIEDVRFYEGSSLYATKRFSAAIQKLQTLISSSPTSPRAPDALMVIASSQVEMNDLASAQKTLARIVKDYPDSPAAETANSRLQLLQ